MPAEHQQRRPPRPFWKSLVDAFRGIAVGLREERHVRFHLVAAAVVVAAGFVLRVARLEWCVLVLSIGAVLGAELFNTALERLARAVTSEEDDNVRDALDAASGAVLVVAAGATVVGLLVLGRAALMRLS